MASVPTTVATRSAQCVYGYKGTPASGDQVFNDKYFLSFLYKAFDHILPAMPLWFGPHIGEWKA